MKLLVLASTLTTSILRTSYTAQYCRYPIDYRIDLVRLSEQSAPLPRSFPFQLRLAGTGISKSESESEGGRTYHRQPTQT